MLLRSATGFRNWATCLACSPHPIPSRNRAGARRPRVSEEARCPPTPSTQLKSPRLKSSATTPYFAYLPADVPTPGLRNKLVNCSTTSKARGGAASKPEHAPSYFLGSMVFIKDPQKRAADVADGQQRLTTLTISFAVLRDPGLGDEADLFIRQHGNRLHDTQDIFRLRLRERDPAFSKRHIREYGATAFLPSAIGSTDTRTPIIENTNFFTRRLANFDPGEARRLRCLSGAAMLYRRRRDIDTRVTVSNFFCVEYTLPGFAIDGYLES